MRMNPLIPVWITYRAYNAFYCLHNLPNSLEDWHLVRSCGVTSIRHSEDQKRSSFLFYGFQRFYRPDQFDQILKDWKLFQQYIEGKKRKMGFELRRYISIRTSNCFMVLTTSLYDIYDGIQEEAKTNRKRYKQRPISFYFLHSVG